MFENLKDKTLILGSQSPRRKELLENLGISFEIKTQNFDESYPKNLSVDVITDYLVKNKMSYYTLKPHEIVIVADTLVVKDNEVLEKPKNINQAKEMLKKLSGSEHTVYTSIGIKTQEKEIILKDKANVFFNELREEEITYYVSTFSVLDKAGSYGIQDWIGYAKIAKIEGSYATIMGLPTHLLYEALAYI